MKLLVSLLLLVFITSCGHYEWQKQGATTADLNRDSYECEIEGAKTYPVQYQTMQSTPGYVTPQTTKCENNYTSASGSSTQTTNCTTTPAQYVGPQVTTEDVNAYNRSQLINKCMQVRGWQSIFIK